MWIQLKLIQEGIYGTDSEVLIYTYKNCGICYLALGIPEKAEEFYLKALEIMNKLKDETQESLNTDELLSEDRQQMATIYFNLYLSATSNDEKQKAKEYNEKAIEYNRLLHGEQSLEVSNGYFIQA